MACGRREVRWREEAPVGKLDLLLALDFRMTSTTLFSDIVLPAATWYEKHDLSSTDMHPFVHAFNPAISPPWQTKTDFDAFHRIARAFSGWPRSTWASAKTSSRCRCSMTRADATATPGGIVLDWKAGECGPIPGKTMPQAGRGRARLPGGRREDGRARARWSNSSGLTTKGVTTYPEAEVEYLQAARTVRCVGGSRRVGRRWPKDIHACEAILALSGTTNGRLAVRGFRGAGAAHRHPTGRPRGRERGQRITFADTQARPVPVITSPEWSGSETGGRRYSPFTINVERLKPWHTLTGRQHFFLDHDWMTELGEQCRSSVRRWT